jgi:ABC-type amino acid transport substrate-binding protein
MNHYIEQLFSKNGVAIIRIAKKLLSFMPGERIPNVSELANEMGTGRGTVQQALKKLEELKLIRLESRGHQGTYLMEIDLLKTWEMVSMSGMAALMPLPYSKRYEGLATGLRQVLEEAGLRLSLAYMRGAENRIQNLMNKRYDFVMTSLYAAEQAIKEGIKISIVMNFGTESYVSGHSLVFKEAANGQIEDGMRVGLDLESIDQKSLTEKVCEGKEVVFVPVPYSQMLSRLQDGHIDACVINSDEVQERYYAFKLVPISFVQRNSNTEAVLVTREEDEKVFRHLFSLVDTKQILAIQNEVIKGIRHPNY